MSDDPDSIYHERLYQQIRDTASEVLDGLQAGRRFSQSLLAETFPEVAEFTQETLESHQRDIDALMRAAALLLPGREASILWAEVAMRHLFIATDLDPQVEAKNIGQGFVDGLWAGLRELSPAERAEQRRQIEQMEQDQSRS